jgi:late competence protein required for DNA uptake (superfamily II DNA/RNA helicase)
MILSREIEIKITESNISYYENLGYDILPGEWLLIPIDILSSGSHHKIKCKCDSCGIEKDVIFKNYVKYYNNWGEYFCRKCSEIKRKQTLQKTYGVDYPIQNEKVMKKMKNTIYEKYGVDNISKNRTIFKQKRQ